MIFQVLQCRGDKGHNVEYVLKLAEWIQEKLPEVHDDHLFDIEKAVRRKIDERGLCIKSLMGDDDHALHMVAIADHHNHGAQASADAKADSGFSSQVRPCCLRCVKV